VSYIWTRVDNVMPKTYIPTNFLIGISPQHIIDYRLSSKHENDRAKVMLHGHEHADTGMA